MAVVAQKALRPLFLLVVKGEQPEQVWVSPKTQL